METVSANECHGGTQWVYRHDALGTTMTFAVFQPPGDGPFPCCGIYPG